MVTPGVEELAAVPALAGIEPATLARIAAATTTIPAGQPVAMSDRLCILEGQVEITLNGAPLGIVHAGDLVIADQHPVGIALTAITPVRLARLPAEQ